MIISRPDMTAPLTNPQMLSQTVSQGTGQAADKETLNAADDTLASGINVSEGQLAEPEVLTSPYEEFDYETLAEDTGSGSVTVKMAAAIYVLKQSYEEQKQILSLIA